MEKLKEIELKYYKGEYTKEETIKELKKVRAQKHPDIPGEDNNGEEFKRISEKIIEIEKNNPLIYNDNELVIQEMRNEIAKINSVKTENHGLDDLKNHRVTLMKEVKSNLRLPKYSSTGIFTFLSFLFLIPKDYLSNTFFGDMLSSDSTINNSLLFIIWLLVLMVTTCLWISAKVTEDILSNYSSMIQIESFRNSLFSNFLRDKERDSYTSVHHFLKDDLINYIFENGIIISQHNKTILPRQLLKTIVKKILSNSYQTENLQIAQSTAEVIINKCISEGIIEKVNNNSGILLSDTYEMIVKYR